MLTGPIRELRSGVGALERFEREMRSAARLSHPNIVIAYSSPPLEGLLAFAMEYVDGTDLYHLVRSAGPLPVSNACYYIYQVAQGLAHNSFLQVVELAARSRLLLRGCKQQSVEFRILYFDSTRDLVPVRLDTAASDKRNDSEKDGCPNKEPPPQR